MNGDYPEALRDSFAGPAGNVRVLVVGDEGDYMSKRWFVRPGSELCSGQQLFGHQSDSTLSVGVNLVVSSAQDLLMACFARVFNLASTFNLAIASTQTLIA